MEIRIKKVYKKAFTLAEILVTLAVMGIVFAAVAPTVNTFNQERQDKVYKAKTGKAYSIISEALRAQFVSTQQRMLGNGAASNLVRYIADSSTVGTVKIVNRTNNGFKTQDGMTFAVSGNNCHLNACFVIVDMDGQSKGKTRLGLGEMINKFDTYANAPIEDAKDADSGHSDIVVFMVKDGQVYPRSQYAAENMRMEANSDTIISSSEIDLQFSELNVNPD